MFFFSFFSTYSNMCVVNYPKQGLEKSPYLKNKANDGVPMLHS